MKRRVPVIVLALLLLVPVWILGMPSATGQFVALVCMAPSSATACPPPPVTLTGSVGSQLSVPVLIQGSDIFSGFDITLKSNHTTLVPTGASLAGSLLSGGTVVLECVGNVLKVGPRCSSTDTSDTFHLVLVGTLLPFSPVTGLLFTALFNVTSTLSATIGYQTGCGQSSVAGTSICVLFTNGSLSNPSVTVQTVTYTMTPIPTFSITTSRTEISLGKGQTGNSTITISSLNGFAGTVTFSTSFNSTAKHPPGLSVQPSSIIVSSGSFNIATFSVSTNNNTNKIVYNVTITATGGGIRGSLGIPVTVLP